MLQSETNVIVIFAVGCFRRRNSQRQAGSRKARNVKVPLEERRREKRIIIASRNKGMCCIHDYIHKNTY